MTDVGKTQLLPTLHVYLCRLCPISSGRELSAVVFGQHVNLILILVIFFWACLKDKIYNSNPRTEELKENVRREIANILAELLQGVNQKNLFRRGEECLRVEEQHFQYLL
jgi:hypothetical protein